MRLSDNDLKKLKHVDLDTRCDRCPLDNWPGGCSEILVGLCTNVAAKAIGLEMEARKKDKMNEKQLPTESELREELQEICDAVNKLDAIEAKIIQQHSGMYVEVYDMYKKDRMVRSFNYFFKPDIQPPAKYRAVFSKPGRQWISCGEMFNGGLRVIDNEEEDGMAYMKHWCDCLDRTHHSEGWDPEWEKDWKL
jgi:hypothetical protein